MPLDLHGAEVIQLAIGGRAIPLANVSIIGCVGVAESADVAAFPLNTPVAILGSGDDKRKLLGTWTDGDTLHQADGTMYGEANPVCVYVRHAPGTTPHRVHHKTPPRPSKLCYRRRASPASSRASSSRPARLTKPPC